MDEPYEIQGRTHRRFRHDPQTTPAEAKKLFGEFADHACIDHIRLDLNSTEQIASRTMDTKFCGFWEGDAKSKHCRECTKPGEPCYDLWNMVLQLAARQFVFTNYRRGKAFGNKYRIESPRGATCYLQMLQGKMSRFPLSIEDFLYVTITGKGGMNQTPSGIRQSPFVDLLLEIIATDPEGEYAIDHVRYDPKDMSESFPTIKKPLRIDLSKLDLEKDKEKEPEGTEPMVLIRFTVEGVLNFDNGELCGPFWPGDVVSVPAKYAWALVGNGSAAYATLSNGERPAFVADYYCPSCGWPLLEHTASITGERYRGCMNYPECKYNERSY